MQVVQVADETKQVTQAHNVEVEEMMQMIKSVKLDQMKQVTGAEVQQRMKLMMPKTLKVLKTLIAEGGPNAKAEVVQDSKPSPLKARARLILT